MRLRPLQAADLAAVHAVELAAFTHPWSLAMLEDCLRVNYCCWVGEIASAVMAHGIMAVAVGECHIFNLCIHPHWQRRGLGRILLRHLLALARKRHALTAFLEVRASNHGARALYAAEGFCEIGIRRGYYPNGAGREDAVMLALELVPLAGSGG
jgi:[ribosomal protein S18]-alanine N-acetyltransferase